MTRWAELRFAGWRLASLSALPMAGAVAGAWLEESRHLGFSTWRTACRGAGLSLVTLADFTLQLMPLAIVGMLLGGVLLLVFGMLAGERHARLCMAAHAGCALTLPVALLLCVLLPPVVMLALDCLLATLAAWLIVTRTPSHAAGVNP